MKVVHVITGLNTGGAEMMLYKLLRYSGQKAETWEVVSLTDAGPVAEKIRKLGMPVCALGANAVSFPFAVLRLAAYLRISRPDLVQTWMYHADVLGGLAVQLSGTRAPVVWGVRMSNLDEKLSRRRTRVLAHIAAALSSWLPERIVCVSESARRAHAALGYDGKKMTVIPNGFDTAEFAPDARARSSVRKELGIPAGVPLVGYVARFDPQKDHRTFVKAARMLEGAHFALAGRGADGKNKELAGWIRSAGLENRFHLLGERGDVARLTAALDAATLTAVYGEGFPNVLGEAMACGVPCVTTNVGDAASVVQDTGVVTEPRDAEGIAAGWRAVLKSRESMGRKARERIVSRFSIDNVVGQYHRLYKDVCSR